MQESVSAVDLARRFLGSTAAAQDRQSAQPRFRCRRAGRATPRSGRHYPLSLRRQRVSLSHHAGRVRGARSDGWRASAGSGGPIPSIGPSFGRAMDQALPAPAPRVPLRDDAALRRSTRCAPEWRPAFAKSLHAAGLPLILYLKSEDGFGSDTRGRARRHRPADRRRRRQSRSSTRWYADDPGSRSISVRPAASRRSNEGHQRHGRAPGHRAPARLRADRHHDRIGLHRAATLQLAVRCLPSKRTGRAPKRFARAFMPLEDLRDAWGPARVLHHATELAGIAADRPDSALRLAARRAAAAAARACRAAPCGSATA